MAKGKKTGGRNIKPGEKIAVGFGRPRLTQQARDLKKLTSDEFIKIANKFHYMNREEITEYLRSPKATMLELAVGGTMVKAVQTQDITRINSILDRSIGKVKYMEDEIEESLDIQSQVKKLSMHDLLTIVKNSLPEEQKEE